MSSSQAITNTMSGQFFILIANDDDQKQSINVGLKSRCDFFFCSFFFVENKLDHK